MAESEESEKTCECKKPIWIIDKKKYNAIELEGKCKICKRQGIVEKKHVVADDKTGLEEYKLIQSKVNTLDHITLQLRVAFIGAMAIITGGTGLFALDLIDIGSDSVGQSILPLEILFSLTALGIVIAGGLFDHHYRTVLYKLEERGMLLEFFLGMGTIRFLEHSIFIVNTKYTFLLFYGFISVMLILIMAYSYPNPQ